VRIFIYLTLTLSSFAVQSAAKVDSSYKLDVLLQTKQVIWGFDFLQDNKIIFTERRGKMFVFDEKSKTTTEVKGLPKIYEAGQGGLLDVRVHPGFIKNNVIYFSFSEPIGKDESTTALGQAVLKGDQLSDFKKLFSGHEPNDNDIHYGSRIEFDLKGHLFLSMGDRDQRHRAQDLGYHQGKILRLNLDGSVPSDNPWFQTSNAKKEIWSFGHRNPQGLTRNPLTNEIWEAEMGPRGGDEINIVRAKNNYGWPLITYGREYYGPKIGEKSKPGMEQPLVFWVPSISPSAISFYTGDKMPEWKNNLFVATLSGTHLRRLVVENEKVSKQEELFMELDYRWRNIRTGPDGYLYFSTDEGRLGRIIRK
jgi:glucose/arabinose dehydrogenase